MRPRNSNLWSANDLPQDFFYALKTSLWSSYIYSCCQTCAICCQLISRGMTFMAHLRRKNKEEEKETPHYVLYTLTRLQKRSCELEWAFILKECLISKIKNKTDVESPYAALSCVCVEWNEESKEKALCSLCLMKFHLYVFYEYWCTSTIWCEEKPHKWGKQLV